jgi:signal transduction histidine kinase
MAVEHNAFPRALSLAVHELRTPVTVVAGYLRMLLKEQGGPLSEKQRKWLEEAERSCGRIGALVAEMSDLGKLESKQLSLARQTFDLAAVVAELASEP